MNLEPIASPGTALANMSPVAASSARAAAPELAGLWEQLERLNSRMQASEATLQSVALGDGVELHRVLMDLESTRLSFDLMLQVRNKVLDAYQELMRLQV